MQQKEFIPKGAGENYNYAQDHCFVKLASQTTNGELCMVEDQLKPGFFLPRHYHKLMTEVFYVLEGEIEFVFDNETLLAKSGDTITVPPMVWHAAKCTEGGKMLTLFKNGRFDLYLKTLSTLSDEDFSNAKTMQSIAEEFDIYAR